ncbi:MAG: EpsG family protein [Eubacterium sp.]|jgi:hypothetical protein|nr:EpsG family protein [Eubacterium sp.]
MLIYVLLPTLMLSTGFIFRRIKGFKWLYSAFWGCALFFIAAIRKYTGHDYVLYENWYNSFYEHTIDSMTYYFRQEKGFIIPLKLMRDYNVSAQIVFAIIALVITVLLVLYVYNNSKNVCVSLVSFVLFGFYFNSLNFMRQIIAALIVCFAYNCIKESRPFRFTAFILLAAVFHVSALMMLPFYFILKIKMNRVTTPLFIVAGIALWIFSEPALQFATRYFYTDYDVLNSAHMTVGLPPAFTILFGVFGVTAFVLQKLLVNDKNKNSIFITAIFFGVFFEFVGMKHSVVSRLSLYFLIPATLILSAQMFEKLKGLYFEKFGENKKRLYLISSATVAGALVFFGTLYGYLLKSDNNGVVPYNTFFSDLTFDEFEYMRDGLRREAE